MAEETTPSPPVSSVTTCGDDNNPPVVDISSAQENVPVPDVSATTEKLPPVVDILAAQEAPPAENPSSGGFFGSTFKNAKKAQVAFTGGAVTAIGLVLIPAPVPLGVIVTAYGMSILATEFEGAQDALEGAKSALEGGLESLGNSLNVKEEGDATTAEEGDENSVIEASEKEEVVELLEEIDEKSKDFSEESECAKQEEVSSTPQEIEEEAKNGTSSAQEAKDTDGKPEKEASSSLEQETEAESEKETVDRLQELKEIPKEKGQGFWRSHTNNMRMASSQFILGKVLPALKSVNVKKNKESESDEQSQVGTSVIAVKDASQEVPAMSDESCMSVPESSASITSISSTDSSSSEDGGIIPSQVNIKEGGGTDSSNHEELYSELVALG